MADTPRKRAREGLKKNPMPAVAQKPILVIDRAQHSADARDIYLSVSPEDILHILRARLDHERITRTAHIKTNYSFTEGSITINDSNSLWLVFNEDRPENVTHQSQPHDRPIAYQILLLLDLRSEEQFSDELQISLVNIRSLLAVDRIIIWSLSNPRPTIVRILKSQKIEFVKFTDKELQPAETLPFFKPLINKTHEHDVAINTAACLLITRLKKLFHLVLSEVAAPVYDSLYGQEKVATNALMNWEEQEIAYIAKKLSASGADSLAIDVGCGTGRHAFKLIQYFKEIYAFDFSPNMIDVAHKRKKSEKDAKIHFDAIDIEYEEVPPERVLDSSGNGRADLVVASFGMGSFIEDTEQFIKKINNWLRPGGFAVVSFYNPNALIMNVVPNWRDTALSAHLDADAKTLRVELNPKTIFHIFCQPYSPAILAMLKTAFEVERICTFPTLMALMPNTLLQEKCAENLFNRADKLLAAQSEINSLVLRLESLITTTPELQSDLRRLFELITDRDLEQMGFYAFAVLRKSGPEGSAHERILALLKAESVSYELIEHDPVFSIADVQEKITASPQQMIKTVLFRHRAERKNIVVLLQAHKRVDKRRVASALSVSPKPLAFASDIDVNRLGFPLGGLAPFGYLDTDGIILLVDEGIAQLIDKSSVYCGAGHNRRTLKLSAQDFKKLISKGKTFRAQ